MDQGFNGFGISDQPIEICPPIPCRTAFVSSRPLVPRRSSFSAHSGTLTRRKLLPALYRLFRGQRLPARFSVIGVARDDRWRRLASATQLRDSLQRVRRASMRTTTSRDRWRTDVLRGRRPRTIARSTRGSPARLQEIDSAGGVLFYLAIPPAAYATVIEQLGASGLAARASPNAGAA